ncbi:phosphate ABC transporter permease PstA [Microbacterium album]|uniref:Phosphate transport system permease protein PstA n=1 Tax=Microbacterium album TaxID=2053191 RepID=A0A917IHQ8_9MICO|nr:phosphate ABC transporter permease PstA [Microbacterium album]GGH47818.1 phosphate transport system permease protein PstA [Microbacterium album]
MSTVVDPPVASPPNETAPRSGPVRPATVLPQRTAPIAPRRNLRGSTREEVFNVVGAVVGGCAIAFLLFGWLAPLTGIIGWFVVAFLAFLGLYVLLARTGNDREHVVDRVVTVLLYSAGTLLFGSLLFIVVFTLVSGWPALRHLNLFTQTMEVAGPLDPLHVGGVLHAIVGTLIQIGIALAITVPLGIGTAIYLNEVGGRFARFVRTISDAMTALPSIVAGLFVYAAVIQLVTLERNGFAAALAIAVMMLPIIIRAADVVLRLVPHNLREASYGLGAGRWKTVWHVVLPTARPGLVTSVILGTARGIGETSPVLLTSGITAVLNLNPFQDPMISLPLQIFALVGSPEPNMIARGFGTAAVLLLLVLGLFVLARVLGGRKPGELSEAERRRVRRRSMEDLQRMTSGREGGNR